MISRSWGCPRVRLKRLAVSDSNEYRGYSVAVWSSTVRRGNSNTWRLLARGIVCSRLHEVAGAKLHIRICGRALLKYLPVCLPLQCTQTAARIHTVDTRALYELSICVPLREPRLNFIAVPRGIFVREGNPPFRHSCGKAQDIDRLHSRSFSLMERQNDYTFCFYFWTSSFYRTPCSTLEAFVQSIFNFLREFNFSLFLFSFSFISI